MGNSIQKPRKKLRAKDSIPTCEICTETVFEYQQFDNKGECDHTFCLDCVAKYVQVKIKDKTGGGKIVCPGLYCQTSLDPSDCRELIGEKLFVEWCDLIFENSIPWQNSSYCPNKNCMELVVNECGGTILKSKCPNCKKFFCFQCNRKWEVINGTDHRCIRNKKMEDMNDVLFIRLMKMNKWVKCPGCGHCVERIEGCNNMNCNRCNTGFCYDCGRKNCRCAYDSFCDECGREKCVCNPENEINKIPIPELLILMSSPILLLVVMLNLK